MKNFQNKMESLVDKVLNEALTPRIEKIKNRIISEKKMKQEIDEMEEFYEIAKQRKIERIKKKKETTEQSAFVLAADAAKDKGEKEFEYPKGSGKIHPVKIKKDIKTESTKKRLQLTENEMVNLIERIVIEQKVKGTKQQETSMKETKKNNNEYINSVKKKMKDYLKDGSEDGYDMNPKKFPRGNKEIKDDVVKKYTPTSDQEEYLETVVKMNGIENMDYDNGFEPNDEWMDLTIEGGAKTGNDSEWGNAVKTDVNKEVNDRRKLKTRQKIKSKSYQKDAQPTEPKNDKYTDTPLTKLGESKENKKVISEIEKMRKIMTHNYKTQ